MLNKKDRPLPSGRLSLRTALILRWILPILCLAWSASYSKEVLYASIANCILTVVYDEMGYAAGHWAGRNIVNAMGFASFEVGACLIASELLIHISLRLLNHNYLLSRRKLPFNGSHILVVCVLQCGYFRHNNSSSGLQGHRRRQTRRTEDSSHRIPRNFSSDTNALPCYVEYRPQPIVGLECSDCYCFQLARRYCRRALRQQD